jgi:glyceraldehyde-3-phosphate dehydrogenase/erythrose-4-phosphate dehydrogenase
MAIKVGINGFGRIGRNVMRTALGDADIDFVAVNDLTDTKTLAHLLKYDSVMGNLEQEISAEGDKISVEGESFKVFSEKDPALIDWNSVGRGDRHRVNRQVYKRPKTRRNTFVGRSKKSSFPRPPKAKT